MSSRARLVPRLTILAAAAFFVVSLGANGQNWCNNPVPTPSPTPRPTPPPQCEPKECDKCTKSPCYVGSGTYSTKADDLVVKTTGFPLRTGRSYQSSLAIDGPLGFGWSSSLIVRLFYAVYVFAAPSTYQKEADIVMPDGARYVFKDSGGGVFTPPSGRYDTLVRNADQSFDLTLQRSRSSLHFDATGNLASMTDDYGNALQWIYDGNGRLQRVQDAAGSGRYFDVFWGADGRVSAVRDSSGRQIQYVYNASGALSSVTDAASRTTTYSYFQGRFSPLLSRTTDPWGRVVTDITYDTSDRVKTYTEAGETYTYTYAYGGNSAVTAKTDSQGNRFIYPFNGVGLVSDTTPPAGGGGPTHTDYYPDGSIQQFIDAVGVKTFYTYTANGSPLMVTWDYQGPTAVRLDYTYDSSFPAKTTAITPKNPVTNQVDPNWQASRFDYYQAGDPAPGALHRVYRVHDDGGTLDTLATYEYDSHGRVTKQTIATGAVTDYGYDAAGNLTTVMSPANNDAGSRPVTTYGHDSLGRVTSVTDPLNQSTVYAYDPLNRVTSVRLPKPSPTSPLNFTTTYAYDNFDSASSLLFVNITDPNGRVRKHGYDQYGQFVKSVDESSNATIYTHARGLLTSITDANGNVTSYAYGPTRLLAATTFPDGAIERYAYTADNLLFQRTDRKNQTISFSYDRLKRLASKSYPNSTSVTYTYQGQKLIQVVDSSVSPTETHIFAYDSAYRMASNTQGPRGTVSYQYNPDDSIASNSVQSGPTATYSYYPDGSLDTIAWSPAPGTFKYAYALAGQYKSISFPNGQTRNLTYDDQGRLTQLSNLAPGGANLATYAYGYDLNYTTGAYTMLGQRVSMTATVPSQGLSNHLFQYDPLYQLSKVTYPNVAPFNSEADSWTYDAIGNRLTNVVNGLPQTYTYFKNGANPLNGQRLQSDGVNGYTYDSNGSQTTRNGAPGSFTFAYDADNRLTSISGAIAATYGYDFQGRRSEKTVAGAMTSYLYDGLNLVGETAPAGSSFYLFGRGIDEPLAEYKAGTLTYFGADALGSVVAENNPTGMVTRSTILDVWGQLRSEAGTRLSPFTYTGRELGEAGTLFYRARYYQPSLGRFISEDPIGFASGDVNAYRYVFAQPVEFGDSFGLRITPCTIACAAITRYICITTTVTCPAGWLCWAASLIVCDLVCDPLEPVTPPPPLRPPGPNQPLPSPPVPTPNPYPHPPRAPSPLPTPGPVPVPGPAPGAAR